MSNNRVKSNQSNRSNQSNQSNRSTRSNQSNQSNRQTNVNKQKRIDPFVLQNDQSSTILNYLQNHCSLRTTEMKNLKNKMFMGYTLTDYEIHKRHMPLTILERQTDMKNKEQSIQKLLLDETIQIPLYVMEYIVLHAEKPDIVKMAIWRCENKDQLKEIFGLAYMYNNITLFSALLNICEKKGVIASFTFNFLEALEYSVKHGLVDIFTKIIDYIRDVYQETSKQIVDYDMVFKKAIESHKLFPFEILIKCENVNKQQIMTYMKDQSKKTYYGNEEFSLSVFKLIFNSKDYLERVPFNVSYTSEIIKKGSCYMKFYMPLFTMKRFIRTILLLKLLSFEAYNPIMEQLIKFFVNDLHEMKKNLLGEESLNWLFKRIKNSTFEGFWWDIFLERESQYREFGNFYYNIFMVKIDSHIYL